MRNIELRIGEEYLFSYPEKDPPQTGKIVSLELDRGVLYARISFENRLCMFRGAPDETKLTLEGDVIPTLWAPDGQLLKEAKKDHIQSEIELLLNRISQLKEYKKTC
jgi:hypothetical protein